MSSPFNDIYIKLKKDFPKLTPENSNITSPPSKKYNCIAWAAADNSRGWWPNKYGYWPPNIPREETLDAFIKAYSTLSYEKCSNSDYEEGYEKIAIYIKDGVPTHAARQLKSGLWTSKLGQSFDIIHTFESLDGGTYGNAEVFMKRKV